MSRLTPKQKKFINEYLIDLNATQAAIRAGYSVKNAFKIGSELLQKTTVQGFLEARQRAREKRTEITQDRVLRELAAIGFADIADYAKVETQEGATDAAGQVRKWQSVILQDTSNLPADKRAAIASIKQGANGIEIKLSDKLKALELIARHLGMFKDKLELDGGMTIKVELTDEVQEWAK